MGLIEKILGANTGNLIEKVGNTVDKFVTTSAEKEQLKQEMLKLIQDHEVNLANIGEQELEVYIKDIQSARDTNVKIQDSEKSSWLSKNVAYILDIFLGAIWGTVTVFIVGKALKIIDNPVDMTAVLSIYGTITAVFMTVINFHRGSSKGSEDKTKQINKMLEK